jgi:dipeptidyl aminopeptidase/acylaminoacyl peptidase
MDLSVPQPNAMSELLVADLLGGVPADQPEAARDASPISWVDEEAAAFLIVHGGGEDTYLAEQSRRMATALFEARVETVYAVLPTVGHDGTNYWYLTGPLILGFLESQVHPAS